MRELERETWHRVCTFVGRIHLNCLRKIATREKRAPEGMRVVTAQIRTSPPPNISLARAILLLTWSSVRLALQRFAVDFS